MAELELNRQFNSLELQPMEDIQNLPGACLQMRHDLANLVVE